MDDETLLAGLQRRDPKVQAAAWRAFFPRLKAACTFVLRDDGLAEELAQDVWLDFTYGHVDRIEHARAVYPYLRLMAVRQAQRRSKRRQRLAPEADAPEQNTSPEAELAEQLDAPLRRRQLESCLDTLTPRARQMLRLKYFREQTIVTIGEAFGISKQAVSKGIGKSLALLKLCLERADG